MSSDENNDATRATPTNAALAANDVNVDDVVSHLTERVREISTRGDDESNKEGDDDDDDDDEKKVDLQSDNLNTERERGRGNDEFRGRRGTEKRRWRCKKNDLYRRDPAVRNRRRTSHSVF